MKLSIVIVSNNSRKSLRRCLASLNRFCRDAEVIVVENASTDGSAAMVHESFPWVILCPLQEPHGAAAATNVGLTIARGEFVAMLDADAVLEGPALERCVEYLGEHFDVGALTPRLMNSDDEPQPSRHPFPTLADQLWAAVRIAPRDHRDGTDSMWLDGTALVVRRTALNEVGGRMDEGYLTCWKECDLCARLLERGWQLVAYPNAFVRYDGPVQVELREPPRSNRYAWNMQGKHRWYAAHRAGWQIAAVWLLDALAVLCKLIHAVLSRRLQSATEGLTLAGVLCGRLLGTASEHPRSQPLAVPAQSQEPAVSSRTQRLPKANRNPRRMAPQSRAIRDLLTNPGGVPDVKSLSGRHHTPTAC